MLNRRMQDALPDGMALVHTADGKWFPAFATVSVRSHRVYVLEESEDFIPPALPPWHDPAQGYDTMGLSPPQATPRRGRGKAIGA